MAAELIVIGDRYGELTVERECQPEERTHATPGREWLCRCDCGGVAIRKTGQLRQALKLGYSPCCARCLEELRGGRWVERSTRKREALREQFLRTGSLYNNGQLDGLCADARRDAVEAGLLPERKGRLRWKDSHTIGASADARLSCTNIARDMDALRKVARGRLPHHALWMQAMAKIAPRVRVEPVRVPAAEAYQAPRREPLPRVQPAPLRVERPESVAPPKPTVRQWLNPGEYGNTIDGELVLLRNGERVAIPLVAAKNGRWTIESEPRSIDGRIVHLKGSYDGDINQAFFQARQQMQEYVAAHNLDWAVLCRPVVLTLRS